MRRSRFPLLTLIVWILCGPPAGAQDPYADYAEELIARERIRAAVEAALEVYLSPAETGGERLDHAIEAAESLVPLGDDVVPYLASELEQERGDTYDFCAYALGLLDGPAAREVLREAIVRAEASFDTHSVARKAWAAWALGMQGEVDALDLVNAGNHRAASYSIHGNTSVLEAIALQTAPESVPRLLAQIDRWSEDEEMLRQRRWSLRAMRRLADPRVVPRVARLLAEDPSPAIRGEAAHTLSTINTEDSMRALVAALQDDEIVVRRGAAVALDRLDARVELDMLYARLQTEGDPITRGAFYNMVVELAGARALDKLPEHWGRGSPADRRLFVLALGRMGGRKSLDLVAGALTDRDNSVAIAAIQVLVDSGAKSAVDRVIGLLKDGNWTVVQAAAEELGAAGVTRAGAALTDRMARAAGQDTHRDRGIRSAVHSTAETLVELRYVEALPELRKARERLTDPLVRSSFDSAIGRLELIEQTGDDVPAWTAVTRDSIAARRFLAYARLADIGTGVAAQALVASFDGAELLDRVEILRQAGRLETPATIGLLERVLLDPEFDPSPRLEEREMAAWGARRIGGSEMFELLKRAVERRRGRDAKVLVYASVLGGKQALPLLDEYELVRMRYLGYSRGFEQETLSWIARRIREGRSLEEVDVRPAEVFFR